MTKIDVFPHILPRPYFERVMAAGPSGLQMGKRMAGIPVLVDLEQRLRIMDRYEGYQSTGSPQVSASAAFQLHTATGKLNALITATGPSGCHVSVRR